MLQWHHGDDIRTTHENTLNQEITTRFGEVQSEIKRLRWYRRAFSAKNRKRTIRYSLLGANLIVLGVVVGFVIQKPSSHRSPINAVLVTNQAAANPLDQLSSADIAVHVARVANLEESTSVANNADTVNAQLTVTPANDIVVTQPQIIATGLKSRQDIQSYVATAGDTVSSIAAKFGVTSDTIKWSNGLNNDTVRAGTQLTISPINGIVYTVKSGDTIDNISAKYQANREKLIAFNDLESGSLPIGEKIVIPEGRQPVATSSRSASVAGGAFAWGGYGAVYGANGYDYGYCTWWAASRRAQSGRPIPSNLGNASTWKVLAQRAGLGVGNTPAAGAVIWTPPRDYYGHVGFVESVNPDGSVNISEMNTAGWGRVSRKTLSAGDAARYSYIY